MPDNGSSERNRPYVVLEQTALATLVTELLEQATVVLSDEDVDKLERTIAGRVVYVERARMPSRNAAHALTQVGRGYDLGVTPPLVAVSERMFRPRRVNIDAGDPKISLG